MIEPHQTSRDRPRAASLPRGTVATRDWHELEDGRLQWDLCPRHCNLCDVQAAFCFMRARRGDQIVLTSHWRMMDRPPTPPETVRLARRTAMDNGVRYAHTGNIRDPEGSSTYCHECGQRLIERVGYSLGEWNLTADGRWNACQTPCAGVFAPKPGGRGAGRWPVYIPPEEIGDPA